MAILVSYSVLLIPVLLIQSVGGSLFGRQSSASNPVVPSDLPGNWTYAGCWTDNAGGTRTLSGLTYNGDSVTDESCISYCSSKNYIYAGTEYAGQCYCGNVIAPAANSTAESNCNMACTGNSTEVCGGSNALTLFWSGQRPPDGPFVDPGPGNWTSIGCYTDDVNARALSYNPQTPGGVNNLTIALCTSTCEAAGYILAGAEYAGECFCGNTFQNYQGPTNDNGTSCDMPCNGNSTEVCGGPNRLSMYSTLGWKSMGCFNDSVNARTLPDPQYGGSDTMTIEQCTGTCQSQYYVLAGVEYSGECYCGNSTTNNGGPASDGSAQCTMPCNGNSLETCGGPNRLNMYSFRGSVPAASTSPTVSPTSSVVTATASTTASTSQGTSAEVTTASSLASGTVIASVTSSGTQSSPTPTSVAQSSLMTTSGAQSIPTTTSGAQSNSTISTGTSSASVTSSVSTGAIASTSSQYPGNFTYQGCYVDDANGRDFNNQQNDNSNMTIESCITTCIGMNYSVAAMEYGVQCFCDDFIRNGGALASSDSQCNMACGGDSSEICGAGNRLSVYSNSTLQVYVPPGPANDSLPGSWQYQGCLSDSNNNRTFPYELTYLNNNTAQACLTQCSTFGYNAAGLEYGQQCFCGDVENVITQGATMLPDSECNMACSGNSSQICGGSNTMSYYAWVNETHPLYTWNFATGNDAGAYEFLIGGVIVPLISTPARNGKIVFLEKWGTGPPNSTGAYELDLAQLNNFTGAWRPMHVKTDVFCSAGLVLPDVAGRHLTVGGWANDATYGVRLYWPDGSPGVWGTNDWQENVEEVSLQSGRWYPTAMTMTNGSILVVGGEVGANGAPVPSLEILPKPPGGYTLYCDYLNRTDPYNLYPFLAVLPSGGIFIEYYNEARILDPVSLETTTVLPNVPAAVNDFLGGRTYPFSGTMVLMPQIAPYSDPVTVLICGGSIPGPEYALDNCVSIQPDTANATWTIERMPSKRVISCMVALPDGTYLILNGAEHGIAGFGTSDTPNTNAILYDPTQPLGSRMTVMANTTVARLYHSEATLLDDGRIIVSGSDPEDDRYPEEYRVEVFVPPYRLSGAAVPAFTLSSTDWAYGQSVEVTVTSSSGGPFRMSLIGAVSSTHGSSMGQRTYFPDFSCSGNSCTVTAPPSVNICPPAWFQVFLLDGTTPSNATWVRIGGDPAGLGNWPDFPDFTVPGV